MRSRARQFAGHKQGQVDAPEKGVTVIGTDTAKRPASPDLLHLVHSSLTDDKAIEPVTVDLTGKTSIADAMVIVTGSSQRHIATMAEHLLERLKAAGLRGLSSEGSGQSDWVLIDAGDVIVHVFKDEVRRFYDLEKLWGAALPEAPSVVRRHA
ncbi:MAG TPA: ribosome silencing factor [Geminicoccaceae bacterium]|nr:ribosome silencing factor [Geminicoccaceae bacterium]